MVWVEGMLFPASYLRDQYEPPPCPCDDDEPCPVHTNLCPSCGATDCSPGTCVGEVGWTPPESDVPVGSEDFAPRGPMPEYSDDDDLPF